MSTKHNLLGIWTAASVAAAIGLTTLAFPAAAQTRPAVASAGSAYVVNGGYMTGIVTKIDTVNHTVTIGPDTYPILGNESNRVSVGDLVNVTFVVVHYGPAAHRVVMGLDRTDQRGPTAD